MFASDTPDLVKEKSGIACKRNLEITQIYCIG